MKGWWKYAIAIGCSFIVGFVLCWCVIVLPSAKRAELALATANAKYLATQGQLDASAQSVRDLEGKLGFENNELSSLAGQLQQARASASGLAKTNSDLTTELERLRSAIADGANGLTSDEGLVGQLAELIRSSLEITSGLQGGH